MPRNAGRQPGAIRGERGASGFGTMSGVAGRIALALGVFVVFGGVALAMGGSALKDWREGRQKRDIATTYFALEQWWPTLIAAAVAVGVPIVIVSQR